MAPVAAASRPPGRPKVRSKVDGRPGLPALYTARNLDRCTRQLGHWNPFASSAGTSPEHSSRGDYVAEDVAKLGSVGHREGGQHAARNPNSGAVPAGVDSGHHMSAQSGLGSLQQRNARGERSFEPLPANSGEGWLRQWAANSGCSDRAGAGVFEFGAFVSSECGATRSVPERRVHSWSKRRKQLSHALARGLWRWKDGFHARKRMKRCGPGGGRNSGSDKSSDRAPYGVHASDPSTAPTSKAGGPFKWSDFPVTPTDSSGELFNCAAGERGSLMSEMNALGKDWTTCGCSRGDGFSGRADCDQCWLGNENQNAESGYGSEPGYRADEELEFGDIDEGQDEEEIEPKHLRMWTQVMARSHGGCEGQSHDNMQVQPPSNHGGEDENPQG
jgi:hypothetical protein